MSRLTIVTAALLGWLFTAPAISADFSSTPGVKPASQSAQQYFPTAASQSASHPAVKDLLAGMAERKRALEAATQLEQLDREESDFWERIMQQMPAATLSPADREKEHSLRRSVLPQLAARQSEYREREGVYLRELTDHLLQYPQTIQDESLTKPALSLASVRNWSEQVDAAQENTRVRLDALHAFPLARNFKARAEVNPEFIAGIQRIRLLRNEVVVRRDTAMDSWMTSREAAQREQLNERTKAAESVTEAATEIQRLAMVLRGSAADHSRYPGARGKLLGALAERSLGTAESAVMWAAARAGAVLPRPGGFLAQTQDSNADDKELTALAADRQRISHDLLASLGERVKTLDGLRKLAQKRQALISSSMKYLPKTAAKSSDAIEWLSGEAQATWDSITELRSISGNVRTAFASTQRAQAAELLGAEMEELLLLEQNLFEAQFALVADPFPAPDDRRPASSAWRSDLSKWISLQNDWVDWKQAWNNHLKREKTSFSSLRKMMGQLDLLWAGRIERFINASSSSQNRDEIDELTDAIVAQAQQQLADYRSGQANLHQALALVAADPIMQASYSAAAEPIWSQTIKGAQAVNSQERQVAVLRNAAALAASARNHKQPVAERLVSLVTLSEVFSIPWTLEGRNSNQVYATVSVSGRNFIVENLLAPRGPKLQRMHELIVTGPTHLASLSLDGIRLAQADNPIHPMAGETPEERLSRLHMEIEGYKAFAVGAGEELWHNKYIYIAMPIVGACVGAACGGIPTGGIGTGPGAVAGGTTGAGAAGYSALIDAAAGGTKGAVRRVITEAHTQGMFDEPTSQKYQEYSDTAIDAIRGVVAIRGLLKAGWNAAPAAWNKSKLLLQGGWKKVLPSATAIDRNLRLTSTLEQIKTKLQEVKDLRSTIERMGEVGAPVSAIEKSLSVVLKDLRTLANRKNHLRVALGVDVGLNEILKHLPQEGGKEIAEIIHQVREALGLPGEAAIKLLSALISTPAAGATDKDKDKDKEQHEPTPIVQKGVVKPAPLDQAQVKPVLPVAVPPAASPTVPTPLAPCTGLNEERNSAGNCDCRSGTELVGGLCKPFCAANMSRDDAGKCACASGHESVGGVCMPKCSPNEERIGNACVPRCGANEERSPQNVCVCKSGFTPTVTGCAPACGPNETRDEGGNCVCSAGFEIWLGGCVPICANGETHTADGNCVLVSGMACDINTPCPAGFLCSPAGICVDNRPSGEDAVNMRSKVNQEQRSQSGRSQLPLYAPTTTSRPERFGLSQMPGGSSQIITPLMGTPDFSSGGTPTSPQQPQQAATTTSTTPSDIACGAGGKCPSGYTCNALTGVCVKQQQATKTPTIPTCTTDRDCPGAKCVNNVCTSAPPIGGSGTSTVKPPPAQPAQQAYQWYLLEGVASFTKNDGMTGVGMKKENCTVTYWAPYWMLQSDLQNSLRSIEKDVMSLAAVPLASTNKSVRLVSSRVYQGPSATELKTPAWPPYKLECGKPY